MEHGTVSAVRRALATLGLDAILLTNITNIGYVSGFTGSTARVLVTKDEALFFTDARYTIQANVECADFVQVAVSGSREYLSAIGRELLTRSDISTVGFEASEVTVELWESLTTRMPSMNWVATRGTVEELRLVKSDAEIAKIEQAIHTAEAAFIGSARWLHPGTTEREVAAAIEYAMRLGGAECPSFETIVASGINGARPHHHAGDRQLVSGDLVTIDWGASQSGYCSDITRTVAIGAAERLSDIQRRAHEAVLEAQAAAVAAIRPGAKGSDLDLAARAVLREYGLEDAFTHSLGHSLGRDVHDGAVLSRQQTDVVLQPGMVFTVEPGVYIPEWGGVRIEDDVVVTQDGCKVLTQLPRTLQFFG